MSENMKKQSVDFIDTNITNITNISNIDIQRLILDNEYIKACFSNKKRDPTSLSYLIDTTLSQSDCIKLGIGIENLLKDLIIKFSNLVNIKPKNKKGAKERDHLFCDHENKIIYYAELKANINLDTEKSISTSLKCLEIAKELGEKYKDYEIKWCLVGYRYIDITDIPVTIQKKYSRISKNLFGINQYLAMLHINIAFDGQTYKNFLNDIARAMFNNS